MSRNSTSESVASEAPTTGHSPRVRGVGGVRSSRRVAHDADDPMTTAPSEVTPITAPSTTVDKATPPSSQRRQCASFDKHNADELHRARAELGHHLLPTWTTPTVVHVSTTTASSGLNNDQIAVELHRARAELGDHLQLPPIVLVPPNVMNDVVNAERICARADIVEPSGY